jgi:hypothetical protein
VILGEVLAILGLLILVFPQPLVWVAAHYRGSMPSPRDGATTAPARIGGLLLLIAGLLIMLAMG